MKEERSKVRDAKKHSILVVGQEFIAGIKAEGVNAMLKQVQKNKAEGVNAMLKQVLKNECRGGQRNAQKLKKNAGRGDQRNA